MKLVYIAGPYRGKTEYETRCNILSAEKWAIRVFFAGGYAVCPHSNTAWLGGLVPDEAFIDGGIELALRCDAMLLIPGWGSSDGAIREHDKARSKGILTFRFDEFDKLMEWIDPLEAARRVGDW